MPGVEWVVGNSHKTQIAELVERRAVSRKHLGRRYLRAARLSLRAGGGRRGRPHAPQPEDPGRLQQPLLVLHHSVRARAQPQRAGGPGRRAGARPQPPLSRSGAERHQSGPLGPRAGQSPSACLADLIRRLLDETAIERLRLSSVEPMDFSDDLLGLMAASPRIARARARAAAIRLRPHPAPHASQVSAAALCGPHREGARA